MIDFQALKLKVLRLALSGQLPYSDASDTSVDELVASMQAQKAHLVKTKKIRADKLPSCIDDSTIPFPIPSYWKWMYLGDVFYHNTGKALNSTDTQGKKLTYITTSNLYWDQFVLEDLRSMYFTDDEIEKCSAIKGDLLVCEGGDYGRAAIWDKDYPIRLQNHIHKLRPYVETCIRFYYYVFFYYKFANMIHGKGIGLEGLSTNKLHQLLIPLPPYEEQKRIVEHVDKAFAILDKMNAVQAEYADNLEALKEKVVEAAMHGQLTEQLTTDTTVQDILKTIHDERQQVGRIKNTDEPDFEIPKEWAVLKTDAVLSLLNGDNYNGDLLPYLEVAYLRGKITPTLLSEGKYAQKGKYAILVDGENSGEVFEIKENGILGSTLKILFIPSCINPRYVKYFLMMHKKYLRQNKTGAEIPHLNKELFRNLDFPIPPVEEQQRIVEQLDNMLSIFDSMTVR